MLSWRCSARWRVRPSGGAVSRAWARFWTSSRPSKSPRTRWPSAGRPRRRGPAADGASQQGARVGGRRRLRRPGGGVARPSAAVLPSWMPTGSTRRRPAACGSRLTSSELLADERRLFYVACTRARRRLVVTAVSSSDDTGERPSRFLAELGVDVREVRERVPVPLSVAALVATLRRLGRRPGPPLRRCDVPRRRGWPAWRC